MTPRNPRAQPQRPVRRAAGGRRVPAARPVGRAVAEAELLDRPDLPVAEAAEALADLERVYRAPFGGGARRRTLLPLLAASSRQRWLDLGAGGGHVGRDLGARAARRGVDLEVVALDRLLRHLLAGRRRGDRFPAVVADAAALPFAAGAFDCAYSHLFFHHFDLATNRAIVGEMVRVARWAVVVDLRRSLLLRLLGRPFLRLLGLGPTALHDGLVSVARSYGLGEVAETVAGERVEQLERRFPGRFALVLRGRGQDPTSRDPPPPAAGRSRRRR
jgi:SAM-dependent methyltransferase